MYAKHVNFFREVEDKYSVFIEFKCLNEKHLGQFIFAERKILISIELIKVLPVELACVFLHEWAHFWLHKKGPDIRGIHGEYLAEYFAWLVIYEDKTSAHNKAMRYKSQVENIYSRIKYPYETLQRAKFRLEGEAPSLRKIYKDVYS